MKNLPPLFNDQIISMYSFGMSTRDIQRHLQQVYGVEVSAETISNITDAVISDVREWQSLPLEKSYPILFLDALRVNSRQDGKNVNKALYVDWQSTGKAGKKSWDCGSLILKELNFGHALCVNKVYNNFLAVQG